MAFWNRKKEPTITLAEHEAIVRELRNVQRKELATERDTVARLVKQKMSLIAELSSFKSVRAKHLAGLAKGRETQAARRAGKAA